MKIRLTLSKSIIIEAVKAETYLKGVIDKSTADQALTAAYNEKAGDEDVHNRKIARGIINSLASLKTDLAAFLYSDSVTSTEEDDKIYLEIEVSSRFNTSLIDAVAKLCSKYIEDKTLMMWWGTLGNQIQTQYYDQLVKTDILEIKQNLTKKSFASIASPYPKYIEGLGSHIDIEVGEKAELTYTINEGAIDDIEACPSNHCVQTYRGRGHFFIEGKHEGECNLLLYSKHDELNVYRYVTVTVKPYSKKPIEIPRI